MTTLDDSERERLRKNCGNAVKQAIKGGRLARLDGSIECIDCGDVADRYDHRSYHRPLDVEPVCRKCNQKRGPAQPLPKHVKTSQKYAWTGLNDGCGDDGISEYTFYGDVRDLYPEDPDVIISDPDYMAAMDEMSRMRRPKNRKPSAVRMVIMNGELRGVLHRTWRKDLGRYCWMGSDDK